MSKIVDQPVLVVTDKKSIPSRFFWYKRWLNVLNILEQWKDTGRWWDGESEKIFYRLQVKEGGIYEIFSDIALNQWRLYKVYD